MARVVLVRHGVAAKGWGDDRDPGLAEQGHVDAERVADRLAPIGPLPIFTSPLLRCQETAQPLASRWGIDAIVEPNVGEVKSPVDDLDGRVQWLDGFLHGQWADVDDATRAWRAAVVDWVCSARDDCVAFTHFVAINACIGEATGDDRVTCLRVANGGCATFTNDGGRLVLVESPDEMVLPRPEVG